MTSRADGWYSYDVATGTTTGLYTATMCCVPTDGTLCIDKSFEVKAPAASPNTLTASDVWNYNNRTLTSFGSLASDIWSSGTRTLTSFGDLVSGIWGHSTRTLTESSSTTNSLTTIQTDLDTQRILLEKLVQEPVITLDLSVSSSVVTEQIESNQRRLTQLTDQVDTLKSTILTKLGSFDQLSKSDRLNLIDNWHTQALALSTEATYFADQYPHELTDSLTTQAQILLSQTRDLKANFGTTSSDNLLTLIDSLTSLSTTLSGDPLTPSSTSLTDLFSAYLKRAAELDNALTNLDHHLSNWSTQTPSSQTSLSRELSTQIMSLNQYVGATEMLSSSATPKNILLSLRAILTMNQKLLLPKGSGSVAGMWLEDGSVIWKASIYNPSKLVSLPATLSFHLPREVKPEHILAHDDTLSINFDPEADSLKVAGQFTLSPLSTTLATIQVEDIWIIPDSTFNDLRTQATEAVSSLGKSQFYSQALSTKQEIDRLITQVEDRQDSSFPPTERIRRYRENQLTLLSAQSQLAELTTLVAQVSSTNSLKGWIGGSQLASTWGLIMIIMGGFAFFGYRLLRPAPLLSSTPSPSLPPALEPAIPLSDSLPLPPMTIPWVPVSIAFGLSLVVLGGLYALNPRLRSPATPAVNQVVPTTAPAPTITPAPTPAPSVSSNPVSPQILPPDGGSVNVRNAPSTSADIVLSVKQATPVTVFATDGDWSQIGFTAKDKLRGYWVKSEYLSHN